jgi:hypothetical protein
MHCLWLNAIVYNFRSSGQVKLCHIWIIRVVADEIILKFFITKKNFNFQSYLLCQLIHALSPTLRTCAKFQIDRKDVLIIKRIDNTNCSWHNYFWFFLWKFFFNIHNHLFCQMFHALSSCKCAKFQIDWICISVLYIDHKISSIQTERQSTRRKFEEKFCKNMVPLGSLEICVRNKVPARNFSKGTSYLKVISQIT